MRNLLIISLVLLISTIVSISQFVFAENWNISIVNSRGHRGTHETIAVDSNDNVHIGYVSPPGNIKHATNSAGIWTSVIVDDHSNSLSLAIGPTNVVHMVYDHGIQGDPKWEDVKHTTISSHTMQTDTLYSGMSKARSIAVDSNNTLHVADTDQEWPGLWHYSDDDSPYELVDTSSYITLSSIAIDSNDKVHISYSDFDNIKYANNTSGSWIITTLDSEDDTSIISSAIDSNNKVHISYTAGGNIKYANNTSGSWIITTLDSGYDTSIAIDSNDKVHISYHATRSDDLKYATNANVPGQPGDSCGQDLVYDCILNCVKETTAYSWIGDGFCDDGTWGMVLTCPEFSNDGGDCNP